MGFDITMVVISTVVCFSVLNQLGSVREGTLISAIFVGVVFGDIYKMFERQNQ